jgi:hypothetical protein
MLISPITPSQRLLPAVLRQLVPDAGLSFREGFQPLKNPGTALRGKGTPEVISHSSNMLRYRGVHLYPVGWMQSSPQHWRQIIESNPWCHRITMGWAVWVSATDRGKRVYFSFSKTSIPTFGPTRPPIQWVPAFYPECNVAGAWSKPLTTPKLRMSGVELYFYTFNGVDRYSLTFTEIFLNPYRS